MRIMGFDLSLTSAGVAVLDVDEGSFFKDKKKLVSNPEATKTYQTWVFAVPGGIVKENSGLKDAYLNLYYREVSMRLIDHYQPDVVVLEDVFMGPNPRVVRSLYNINSSIPVEMVRRLVDGETLAPSVFAHVQNGSWKSWITRNTHKLDKEYQFDKTPKKLIQARLKSIGYVVSEINGNEDRYDALGMALGWYLNYLATGEHFGDALDSGLVDRLLDRDAWLSGFTF